MINITYLQRFITKRQKKSKNLKKTLAFINFIIYKVFVKLMGA